MHNPAVQCVLGNNCIFLPQGGQGGNIEWTYSMLGVFVTMPAIVIHALT